MGLVRPLEGGRSHQVRVAMYLFISTFITTDLDSLQTRHRR